MSTPRPQTPGTLELVRRARQGDHAAFEQLYRRNVGRVHALCLRMSGDATVTDDLTQEVFVQAWRRLETFRGDSAFGTWLHQVAVRVVIGDRRSNLRHLAGRVSVEDSGSLLCATSPRAHSTVLDLERCVRTLPQRARQVFILHDVEGYRHAEIAALMGTTDGTSKGQLHRARRLLREALNR